MLAWPVGRSLDPPDSGRRVSATDRSRGRLHAEPCLVRRRPVRGVRARSPAKRCSDDPGFSLSRALPETEAEDLWKLDLALRGDKLLGSGWTDWVFTGKQPSGKTESRDNPPSFAMGVAGGGPGVNAVLESDPELTVIVLSNLDPPTASRLGRQLKRAFAGGS